MNVLFLAYWGLHDGLTSSTVMPHLDIIVRNPKIAKVILCTIEREEVLSECFLSDRIYHVPWISSHRVTDKVMDFTRLPQKIVQIIDQHEISFMFCRGTPAGAIGYLVHRKTNIGFSVESFEPHADYMRESGVWSSFGLRYILQKYFEKKQLECAKYIMPVSRQYINHLLAQGTGADKLFVMPCAVDLLAFAFNVEDRISIRRSLGIPPHVTVGIYVGKFGGMYYDAEAFDIFAKAKEYIGEFFLIILSPDRQESIAERLLKAGYLPGDFNIKYVPHSKVSPYLSAADFAFATYKPGFFKRFLSPVKIGEYWAAGLPVLLTAGIGDDHLLIEELKIGTLFSYRENEMSMCFSELKAILKEGRVNTNARIQPVAAQYRNFASTELVYNKIINALS